jgi:hypothetical protein
LSAPSRATASNIKKMAKKIKNLQFFLDVFDSFGPNMTYIIACSTRVVNGFKETITVIDLY